MQKKARSNLRRSGLHVRRLARALVNHGLQPLQGQHTDFLGRGLGLESHLFTSKGIGAFPFLRGGFLDDLQLEQTRHCEQATTAETLADDAAHGTGPRGAYELPVQVEGDLAVADATLERRLQRRMQLEITIPVFGPRGAARA